MGYRVQYRRDTAARWAEINPILLDGEIGYVKDNPNQYKMGDGVHRWNDLPLRGFDGTIAPTLGYDDNAVLSQRIVTEKFEEQNEKISDLGSKVGGLNTAVGLENSMELVSYSNDARFEFPLKVGQVLNITNNSSVACSVYTIDGNGSVLESIASPLAPNESVEYTIKKESNVIGGFISAPPYKIKVESKSRGLLYDVEKLYESQEDLKNRSFNNDGFLVRIGYDKGSDFIVGATNSELILKCALYASKSGTTYIRGFYNIDNTITLDNSKFSFVILNLESGEIFVSNSDLDIQNNNLVVLLARTPTAHLSGHLATWAYSVIAEKETAQLFNESKDLIEEVKTSIEGTSEYMEFESNENNARFDFPIQIGQTIKVTNMGTVQCSAQTFNGNTMVEIIKSPIAVGETVTFTATKTANKIGGYIGTAPYKIKVGMPNNDGLSQRVETIEKKQEQASGADIYFQFHGHPFYSHMLIDKQNSSQIIPCMSLDDVNMAARMGFKFIEPSGAITSDGVYLVNHTVAKTIDGVSKQVFAGGCKYKGTDNPANDFAVNEKTAAWIRENVCYYSKYKKYESFVPTLEEFCIACRQNNIGVFLSTMREDDIQLALSIIGPDNLIIYSGNIERLIEWRGKYNNMTMMYYDPSKTTIVDDTVSKANAIGKPLLYCVDVPAFRSMSDETMKDFVHKMHDSGFLVGCAACYMDESEVRKAIKFGFDVFASGGHMNDFIGNTYKQRGDVDFSDFKLNGSTSINGGTLVLQDGATVQGGDTSNDPQIHFFIKTLLRIKFEGTLKIFISGVHSNTVTVTSDGKDYETFSDLGIETSFSLWLISVGETKIHSIEYNGSVC